MRTAGDLARHLSARLDGNANATIAGLASPENAQPEDVIFVDAERSLERAARSRAECVLLPAGLALPHKTAIYVENPKLAFAKAAEFLLPRAQRGAGVHPTAVVAASARLGKEVFIGPFCIIEEHAEIGDGAEIAAHCFVGAEAKLGENCRLHPRVVIYSDSVLGRGVVVHAGTVIGSEGFGYVFGEGKHWKFPQIGGVEIGDDVEIGSNCTIDRGSLGVTRIGAGCKLDNLVHVAHNVVIGEHTVIAAQTGISGSVEIGHHVVMGGQVGIADKCRIGDGAILGAQAGIPTGKAIPAGQTVWGTPARPLEKFKVQYAWFARLPDLAERLRKLEKQSGNR